MGQVICHAVPFVCRGCPTRRSLCTLFHLGTQLARQGVSSIMVPTKNYPFDALQHQGLGLTRADKLHVYRSSTFDTF